MAFGLPAILMFVATILFILGSKFYTKVPPQGNVLAKVFKVLRTALTERKRSSSKHSHWLDYAVSQHGAGIVRDVKALFGVLIVFLPVPVFWALFDQQSSRWTYQSIHMDREVQVFGHTIVIQPDMVQVLNPLFVIALIPFFEAAVYPGLRRLGLFLKPVGDCSASSCFPSPPPSRSFVCVVTVAKNGDWTFPVRLVLYHCRFYPAASQ